MDWQFASQRRASVVSMDSSGAASRDGKLGALRHNPISAPHSRTAPVSTRKWLPARTSLRRIPPPPLIFAYLLAMRGGPSHSSHSNCLSISQLAVSIRGRYSRISAALSGPQLAESLPLYLSVKRKHLGLPHLRKSLQTHDITNFYPTRKNITLGPFPPPRKAPHAPVSARRRKHCLIH